MRLNPVESLYVANDPLFSYFMPRPTRSKRLYWLRLCIVQIGRAYDAFHRFLARITGRWGMPMSADIYHAVEHSEGVSVKGRVLLAKKWRHPRVKDHPIVNLLQMIRRWTTPERPFSLVRLSVGGATVEQRADRQAYFKIDIPASEVKSKELLIELPESKVSHSRTMKIRRSGNDARCVVISDIDDTVLVTHVARTLRMIATTLFGNALTRQLFPGTAELYRALRHGTTPNIRERNPIIYVTSSPFNLHALLRLVFKENGLPDGAYFMTDWGIDIDKWFKIGHAEHKSQSIEQAFNWHPQKPVILVGDSSQHDTDVYVETALAHPGKVDQILIRDVTGPDHIEQFQDKVKELRDSGTDFAFFRDSAEAAEILEAKGWITKEQLAVVVKAVKESPKALGADLLHH